MVHTKVGGKPQVARGQNHGPDAFYETDDICPDVWPTTNRPSKRHAPSRHRAHIPSKWAENGTAAPAPARQRGDIYAPVKAPKNAEKDVSCGHSNASP